MRKLLFILIYFLPVFAFSQSDTVYDSEQRKVFSLIEKVKAGNKFVESLDAEALSSLPIGIIKEIGATRYIIAIDSAVFKPNGAYFNAYMSIEYPGTDKQIAFAAKNIKFNPSGVIGGEQSRLVLVSKHSFKINPHVKLNLNPDGRNFIEWNCEGFQSVNLRGEFEFSKDKMIPLVNDVPDTSQRVKASFEIHTNDIHHFITSVSITPFTLRGLKDWSFKVTDAVVDMSDINNHPSMIFPVGYMMDFPAYPQFWTGFYLRELQVKLPSELNKNNQSTEFLARNILIDGTGFTGNISANNLFSMQEANMNGWGFSLEDFGVSFISNRLVSGFMNGKIKIPAMEENGLEYEALISYLPATKQTNYAFTVSMQNDIAFEVFKAKVDIHSSSQITVQKQNGKFIPKAILNGKISLENENVKTAKIDFQNLTFVTYAPFLINGSFGNLDPTNHTQNKTAGFDVSISNVRLVVSETKPKIAFDATINFMDVGDYSFASHTTVKFGANVGTENGLQAWRFDDVSISKIGLNVATQLFYLGGEIEFFKDHPVNGKGFKGKLIFRLKEVMDHNLEVNTIFGSKEFKYFYVDAFLPVTISMGALMNITRLNGGLYYHMRPINSSPSQFYSNIHTVVATSTDIEKYIPDETIRLGFKAGVSFQYAKSEKALNGDAMLELATNTSGGLEFIRFNGKAFMLATVTERQQKPAPAWGTALIQYDHINKIFDANLDFTIYSEGINGVANSKIHIEPQTWFVCIGKPSLPASLTLKGFGTSSAYVMAGNQLEPMAAVPSQVQSIVSSSNLNSQRNETALANATGFAGGIRFSSAFSNERDGENDKVENFKVYASFAYGVGFDMMLANYGAHAHCSGSNEQIGLNGWMANGQLYCYLQGGIGIRGKAFGDEFDINILNGSVAALLGGKLPKPTYLYGALACQYTILGVIKGSFSFDFQLGNDCAIVN